MTYILPIEYGICLLLAAALSVLYIFTLPPHLQSSPLQASYRMPPGPRGRLIIGSLSEWLTVRNGRSKLAPWLVHQAAHGEMTTLHLGTKTWVLLNTSRVVNGIIIKRAALTHERPYLPIAGGLVSRDKRFFLKKTSDWKAGRRLMHRLMTGEESRNHASIVEEESAHLLQACLTQPDKWYEHTYRFPISVIHRITTGIALDKTTKQLEDLQLVTSTFLTSINSHFVDFFPQLAWLPKPLQFWRTKWEVMGAFHARIFRQWWDAMDPIKAASAGPSFVRDSLLSVFGDMDDEAMYLALFLLTAGGDNPRMTLNAWFMSCVAAPATLDKVQAELDRVCGTSPLRLPELADLPNCPYTAAIVKEVLRWRPTVPLIPQRVLIQDLDFEDYRFPKGTEFLVNSISVCSSGYEDAGQFLPERWLDGDTSDATAGGVAQDLWAYAFSGGRRMCVGYKLAQKELFIAVARLAYCFDIQPAGAFEDTVLNPFEPGEPFPVRLSIRSPAHERLVQSATETKR